MFVHACTFFDLKTFIQKDEKGKRKKTLFFKKKSTFVKERNLDCDDDWWLLVVLFLYIFFSSFCGHSYRLFSNNFFWLVSPPPQPGLWVAAVDQRLTLHPLWETFSKHGVVRLNDSLGVNLSKSSLQIFLSFFFPRFFFFFYLRGNCGKKKSFQFGQYHSPFAWASEVVQCQN